MKKRFLVFSLALLIFSLSLSMSVSAGSFEIDFSSIKIVIKSNSFFSQEMKIINNQNESSHFELELIDLENLVFLETSSFDLLPRETRTIKIVFSNNKNLANGVYAGSLEIYSEQDKKSIPVVLEIESREVLFDSNMEVFPKANIVPGDGINVQFKIYDLAKIGMASVEIEYFISDFKGNTISSEKENIVVKDEASITKSTKLPEEIEKGSYVAGVILRYKNSVGTASAFFNVGESVEEKHSPDKNIVYIIIVLVSILAVLFVLVFYFIYSKDRLLGELERQFKSELKKQEKCIADREKLFECKLKTQREKQASRRIFARVRKHRKEVLKELHRKRVRKIRQLKKENKKQEMQKQIERWKKRGYDTSIIEKRKISGMKGVNKQIREWKSKGYDTSILEREIR